MQPNRNFLRKDSFNSSNDSNSPTKNHTRLNSPTKIWTSDLLKKKNQSIRIFSDKKKRLISWDTSKSKKNIYAYLELEKSVRLDSGKNYEILRGYKKSSNRYKLVKMIDKTKIFNSGKIIKRELCLHQTLKSSHTVLKLENFFESETHFYLVYEDGEIMKESQIQNFLSKSELRKLFCSVAIALSEINTLNFCLGSLEPKNIIKIGSDSNPIYKLFNFPNLVKYGEKIEKHIGDVNFNISEDCKGNPKVDSRALGILMARSYQRMTYSLVGHPFNAQYLKNLMEDHGLDETEKNVILGLTSQNYKKRLRIFEVLMHTYFLEVIIKSYKIQRQVTATFNFIKNIDFKDIRGKLEGEKKLKEKHKNRLRSLAQISRERAGMNSKFSQRGRSFAGISPRALGSRHSFKKGSKIGFGAFGKGRNTLKRPDDERIIQEEKRGRIKDKSREKKRKRLASRKRNLGQPKRLKKQGGFFSRLLGGFGCCGER